MPRTHWHWRWRTHRRRGATALLCPKEYDTTEAQSTNLQAAGKPQIPNPKSQKNPKTQVGNKRIDAGRRFWDLEFGIFLGFGVWDLGFGTMAMITFLHGKLIESLPTQVTVEVNGVGYEVIIPLSSYDKLPPPGQPVKLLTHLAVREDAHILYGFMSAAERELFRLLIHTVSGIGPKIALNVLSGISVTAFRGAVANQDIKLLSQISGVGKKTAERIVVELKDKVGAAGAWEALSAQRALSPDDQKINDAVLALMALGFKPVEAHDSVRKAQAALGVQATVEDIVRACLKKGA